MTGPVIYGLTTCVTLLCAVQVLLSRRTLVAGYYLAGTLVGVGGLLWEWRNTTLDSLTNFRYRR